MTPLVRWVPLGATVTEAKALMHQHGVRHLPVIDRGRVVGMVTLSDLYVLESLLAIDPDIHQIDSAMSPEVLVVKESTPLSEVAREMSTRRVGSAVVKKGESITGIFTATDALRALGEILDKQT